MHLDSFGDQPYWILLSSQELQLHPMLVTGNSFSQSYHCNCTASDEGLGDMWLLTHSSSTNAIGLAAAHPLEERLCMLLRKDGGVRVRAQRRCQSRQCIPHCYKQVLIWILLDTGGKSRSIRIAAKPCQFLLIRRGQPGIVDMPLWRTSQLQIGLPWTG